MNEWTTEVPTEEGYYWFCDNTGDVDLIELFGMSYDSSVLVDSHTSQPLDEIVVRWGITHWMKIPKPSEPGDR